MPLGVNPVASTLPLQAGIEPISTVDATQNAYSLASQGMQVENQAQQRNDQKLVQNYLRSGGDITTQEGLDKAAQDLKGQLTPKAYGDLVDHGRKFKEWSLGMEQEMAKAPVEKLKAGLMQSDMMLQIMEPAYDAYEQSVNKRLAARGYTDPSKAPSSEVEQAKQDAMPDFQAAKQERLQMVKQASPNLPPQLLQHFDQLDPDGARVEMQHTKFFQDRLKAGVDLQEKESVTRKNNALADAAKNKNPLNSIKAIDLAIENGDITADEGKALKNKLTAVASGKAGDQMVDESTITPEERRLAVNQWINNPSSMRGMNKTYQQRVLNWAGALGITPEDVNAGRAKMKFDLSAAGSAGRRAGSMATVEETMPGLIDQALKASAEVPRGKFVPWNKLMQMKEEMLSDPALRRLRLANQALASEFQQVISRGGANVTALTEAMHQLNVAESPQAYKVALDQLQKEIDVNVEGAEKVRSKMGGQAAEKLASPETKDRLRILQDEMKNAQSQLAAAKDPNEKAISQANIDELNKEIKNLGGTVTTKPATSRGASPVFKDSQGNAKAVRDGDKVRLPNGSATFRGGKLVNDQTGQIWDGKAWTTQQ